LDKVTCWHFQNTSKEAIWPKKIWNFMPGKKVPLWQFFRKGWDDHALLVVMSSSWNFPARASPSYEKFEPSRAKLGTSICELIPS
jgi:hypothetical protein